MRLTTSVGDSVRPADRYLLPYEHPLVAVRYHPAILLRPTLVVLAGLVAALSAPLELSGNVLLAVWLAWGVLLFGLTWKIIRWWVGLFIATSERILVVSGVLARDVAMIPYSQFIDINLERSGIGRSLGYGSFILDVADQDVPTWKIDFLPFPEQLFLEVFSAVDPYLPDESVSE
jgi:membrane protein YdbS with pleckstrin-like domain